MKNLNGAPDFSARTQLADKLTALSNWMRDQLTEYDPSGAYINVFCVRKYGATEGLPGNPDHIFGATVVRTVVVEDVGGLTDTTLLVGHELGHALAGVTGHSDLPGSLMAAKPTLNSRHLFPQDVFAMRGPPA